MNRFIHCETSKFLFVLLIFESLVVKHVDTLSWTDFPVLFWLISYISTDIRTLLPILNSSPDRRQQLVRRWLTFRNVYTLLTNMTLLGGLLLRVLGNLLGQCRQDCPQGDNTVAFTAAMLWAMGALLTFLRLSQVTIFNIFKQC